MGVYDPAGARRRGRGLRLLRARDRGDLARGRRPRRRPFGVHVSAATMPIVAARHARAGRAARAAARAGPRARRRSRSPRPGSGSDAGAMLHARGRRRRRCALTGTKQWITNGSHAHTFLVFARDRRPATVRARSSCGAARAGFRVLREEEKLGLHSSSTADLGFEDTPAERLGRAGRRHADRARDARRRADRDRRAGDRASRRRRSTSRPATRRSAARSARPIGGFQAHPAEARRHADRDRGRAGAHAGAPRG